MKTTFNVLIVEDDEDDQFLMKTAFETDSNRYDIRFVSDGTQVLANLDGTDFLPDIVLLDLNMPLIDGFEVLTNLRGSKAYRYVPVLILTTSDNEADVIRAYELGANTFLTKPNGHQQLIELAAQIRNYWFKLAKIPTRRLNH
ncbi:response regulator [Spirosoma sp. BT702]|uniref:Response regulator n=1 Tax=Spirosoma profusum TaxID=2771354 RepID=A0A926XYP9_9BACT|nr:response regulator [Spirosoma profusum]MBD2703328.1 response regulator [Spirosoma profusum]